MKILMSATHQVLAGTRMLNDSTDPILQIRTFEMKLFDQFTTKKISEGSSLKINTLVFLSSGGLGGKNFFFWLLRYEIDREVFVRRVLTFNRGPVLDRQAIAVFRAFPGWKMRKINTSGSSIYQEPPDH